MITDINGNTEGLTGYKGLKRTRNVNGEKTLSFIVLPTLQNQHSFDMVQEESIVEFDGETYRIKQMSEKPRGPFVFKEVSAIHTFFDLIDDFQYDTYTGSMTFDAALNFVLGPTDYTWDILDTFYAQDFDNFGNDNLLALLQELLKRYGAEFTLNGTHLTFRLKIGNATDFQFRYNYNIKTITRSVNTNNLSTYIKGFGKKNEDGTYAVQSEYTSPNASIFGIRHAKPIYDERYTTIDGLNTALASSLKDVPDVSITIDFIDLRRAGFPYDVPNEGDDVFLIFEPMNELDLETRLMEITEEFTEFNDYPIKTEVTLSNFRNNMTDKLVEFSRTQKTVSDIVEGNKKLPYSVLDDAVKRATEALQSAQTELEFNNGIIAIAKDNPNHLVLFNSSGIGVSLDGGATFRTAMTADGFVADLITVGTMKFDRLQGGSLKVGDPNIDGDFQVWADFNDDGSKDIIGRVDWTGAYFPYLKSDNIVGNVLNKYKWYATETYYFDLDNGSESNDGLSTSTPKKDILSFITNFPKDLNGSNITLKCKGSLDGTLTIYGFRDGYLTIQDWDGSYGFTVKTLWAENNDCPIILRYMKLTGDGETGNYMATAFHCRKVYWQYIKCYGQSGAPNNGFYAFGSRFVLTDCHCYNVHDCGLYAGEAANGYFVNCHGVTNNAVICDQGAIVTGIGARWSGALTRWSNGIIGAPADNNVDWQLDLWWSDTGEVSPTVPTTTIGQQTTTFVPSTGDNFSTQGFWTNDEVKQGNWGYGDRYGIWYVDLSRIKGKTIDSATITVNGIGAGYNGNKTIFIRSHNYIDRSQRPAGAPVLSSSYAAATVANGGTYTIDIKSLVQSNIASGADRSLGVYTTGNANYMYVTTRPSITITYH